MTFAPDVLHALERSLSPQALAEIVAAGHSADQPPARNPIPGPAAPEQNKAWTPILHLDPYEGVEVRLIKMACVKETNGLGSDHIQLAGLTTSANGTTGKIAPFTVSDDFDDGEYVIFGLWFDWTTLQMHNDGPQTFAKFRYASDDTISQPGHTYKVRWPRQYWVTFLLCEIDNGGFPGFVDDVFNELKGRVSVAVAAAVVGATIGGTALSEIPGLGTAIGAAIGALLGWLLGEIWDALKSWWEDDEFTPITCYVTMQNSLQRFQNGTSDSAKSKVLTWTDMGSDYRLRFDWTVYQVH
jgi:hypothetical protein